MERVGVASIAILPSGSLSGHFIDAHTSQCFGLFGTQISCVRECSRGEDYKLIDLTVLDYSTKREVQIIVESHGHDAARFENAIDIHGWEEEIMEAIHGGKTKTVSTPSIKFQCEILKADEDAEQHIRKYLPSLADRGAVVNIGTMHIKGLKFDREEPSEAMENGTLTEEHDRNDTRCSDDCTREDIADVSGSRSDHEDTEDVSGNNQSDRVGPSSILATERGSCSSSCASIDKEFNAIFQKELNAEGLSDARLCMLPGLREKTSCGLVHDACLK